MAASTITSAGIGATATGDDETTMDKTDRVTTIKSRETIKKQIKAIHQQ